MRIGIRSGLPLGKISKALLLGVAPIVMVVPGTEVAFSQRVAASAAQAPLFTAIDLNPTGFDESHGSGISGGEQVGYGSGPTTGGDIHALLWHGSAASAVDLHPIGSIAKVWWWSGILSNSLAVGTCGGQQVGFGDGHALLWRGTAVSVVDLHQRRFDYSEGYGISRGQQVGYGPELTSKKIPHALMWRGDSASVVDLHPPSNSGFWSSYALGTSGEEQVGYGLTGRDDAHALLWHGSGASVVDLHPHPSGFLSSRALGTFGRQQVGYGSGPATMGQTHALLWHDTAVSMVDLHPTGFFYSRALSTNGEEQVGWGDRHALLWRGSAAGVVDLHAFLPPGFAISSALDIDATGDIVGTALGPASGNRYHAFLWRRNAPKPGTSPSQATIRC